MTSPGPSPKSESEEIREPELEITRELRGPATARLMPGELVAERFLIERLAGAGGMGAVYRAKDLSSGQPVAVKIMAVQLTTTEERFAREARVLAQLSHPAVVRYIAHGLTGHDVPFLAMEWLEGEDLAMRLRRSGLSLEETVRFVRRVAEGLALAHEQGVTHRDIKPCNIFLVERLPEAAKLLDFGVARQTASLNTLTREGSALGTVGYMAPEQALGARDVDARADIFSLGCVMFECLTGQPAFHGPHEVAVLAKVLRDEPLRVSELRDDVPANLDDLVASMLAKEPSGRPRDARTLLAALDQLGELRGGAIRAPKKASNSRLVDSEQRIASVVIARPGRPASATLAPHQAEAEAARLNALLKRFGAQPVPLRGGQILLVFGTGRSTIATDQATQAVRCALRLRRLKPGLEISVATGGVETALNVSVGAAIDRAAALLEEGESATEAVRIDELTAGLLDGRFEVQQHAQILTVVAEREELERPRLLLGKPTPCVGREKELGLLSATLSECIDDQVARVLLVTAQPGTGKSRLGREFLERVRRGAQARVWITRADPMSMGSALNLVQRLVMHAVGLREGDPASLRNRRLREYLTQLASEAQQPFLLEFLGELVGAPQAREPSALLVAARNDPAVMREQMRRAFHQWLAAECARSPVVILLEDLHWGDLPSIQYLEEACAAMAERALLLVVLARPEVHEQFPALFRSVGMQEVRLPGLTRRAAERLVRATLPDTTSNDIIARLLDLADGNAFYLEELIRHVAEGGTELPATVRAIVQSRLERLAPEARRHLRAASVFGETTWVGGVGALLGSAADASTWFELLTREEIFVQRHHARFASEAEYVFRHAFLRDAAYAMLTEEDRRTAHELAGEWLETMGERDPCVLADHYERSTTPARARPWLLRASRAALGNGDLAAAVALAQRGLNLEPVGQERGEFLLVQGHASAWGTQTNLELAREALSLLPEASGTWWFSLALLVFGASAIGRGELATPYLELAQRSPPPPSEARIGAYGQGFEVLAVGSVLVGRADIGWAVYEKFQEIAADYVSQAWLKLTACQLATNSLKGGVWQLEHAYREGNEAVSGMQMAGAVSGEATALFHLGVTCRELGLYERAEQMFSESLLKATAVENVLISEFSRLVLAVFALRRGQREHGLSELAALRQSSDANIVHGSQAVRAEAMLRSGQTHEAAALAAEAVQGPGLIYRITAALTLARAQRALGNPEAALETLQNAAKARGSTCFPQFEFDLQSSRADLFRELGDPTQAEEAERQALRFAHQTASAITSNELRDAFMRRMRLSTRARTRADG